MRSCSVPTVVCSLEVMSGVRLHLRVEKGFVLAGPTGYRQRSTPVMPFKFGFWIPVQPSFSHRALGTEFVPDLNPFDAPLTLSVQATREEVFQADVLGWCIEWVRP